MQHPEEGVIHTWLDGELSTDEARALEVHIAECTDCSALVAEARGLIAASSRIVSALDTVPGDVIPAAIPRKRAWYASTQLRAAAAVVFVAGASLLLVQRERAPEMERSAARVVSAPAVAENQSASAPVADQAQATPNVPGAPTESQPARAKAELRPFLKAPAASPAADAGKQRSNTAGNEADFSRGAARKVADNLPSSKSAVEEKALEGKIAGAQMAPVPPSAAVAPMAIQRSAQASRLRTSPKNLDEVTVTGVVVTGVATATAAPAEALLREVKSDTTANSVRTVYEVSPGVQVTLVESIPAAFAPRQAEAMRKEASGNPTIASPPAVWRITTRTETVTWTNSSTGRLYTLTGPLSKQQLIALRQRLPTAKSSARHSLHMSWVPNRAPSECRAGNSRTDWRFSSSRTTQCLSSRSSST